MQIAYGPPGHKGVTHLMAVGADDYPDAQLEHVVRVGGLASVALLLFGALTKRPRLTGAALGAGAAFATVYAVGRRARSVTAA